MATRACRPGSGTRTKRTRTKRYLAAAVAVAGLLAGCSGGGGHKSARAGLPTPAAGKIAAFDLGALSDTYDLNEDVMSGDTLVTTSRSGDVYMVEWDGADHPDVLRMTPQGVVARYVRVDHRVDNASLVVRSDGSVVFGVLKQSPPTRVAKLPVTDKDGRTTALAIPPTSDNALPVGERPDGSLVISEGGDLWALGNGTSTRLYHQSAPIFTGAVVDPAGTVYSATGDLSDIVAIPVGKAPEHLHLSGTLPGTHTAIASLRLSHLAPATGGGFYALAQDTAGSSAAVVYVHNGRATVLAKTPNDGHACTPGHQYPALTSTCGTQAYIAQSGKRVLLLGNLVHRSSADPALALAAAGS
ncbi:hypothetical protein [Actinacidiphila sp. bgisy145]|uniref:hypothetical protein n=1 Tax=Actinacidiphila sp. bgisy145 TaxID=3413792 RepID=UPI003EBBE095